MQRMSAIRERSNYMPTGFGVGPSSARWMHNKPARVIVWLYCSVMVSLCLLAIAAALNYTLVFLVALVGTVVLSVEAAIFMPRARRAMRDKRKP
jgi:hypothetical protein